MMLSAEPPFEESFEVVKARATARKLASSSLPMAVIGEAGTGRATFAAELARLRHVKLGCAPCADIQGTMGFREEVAAAFTDPSGNTFAPVVHDVELLDERTQLRLAALIRGKQFLPFFVSALDPVDASQPRGMVQELRSLVSASVTLPPLRDRGGDAARWAEVLMDAARSELGNTRTAMSAGAIKAIQAHRWPGNLTEMSGRIRRAMALSRTNEITEQDLELPLPGAAVAFQTLNDAVEEFKARYVLQTLQRFDGNRTQTAKALGVDARTVFRYLEKLRDE